ncbi:General transcription factor IIH subunit 4 [Plasmodiophora brassicae]
MSAIVVDGGIMEYLCASDVDTLDALYSDRYTCLAVFRSLSRIGKQIVCRLLPCQPGQVVPEGLLASWIRQRTSGRLLYQTVLADCKRLRLLNPLEKSDDDAKEYVLNERFHQRMYESLQPGAVEIDDGVAAHDPNPPSLSDLVKTAELRWEMLLHYMVGSQRYSPPSKPVTNLLKKMDLISVQNGQVRPTSFGFKFLFKDLYSQLWTILIGYMNNLEARSMNRREVLSFLFRLGFLELGKGYSLRTLTASQKKVVADLFEFGMIHRATAKSDWYYPTSLAIGLSSGKSESLGGGATQRFIIVETTFKVYAYTASPLQIALLGMFVGLEARLPNLIVARITKKTIRRALSIGIGAEEIIAFLRAHAHQASALLGNVASDLNSPPDNVVDQIRLWQSERHRLSSRPAALFRQFKDRDEFQTLLDFAESKQLVLWKSPESMMFVTVPHGDVPIREYLNRIRGPTTATNTAIS